MHHNQSNPILFKFSERVGGGGGGEVEIERMLLPRSLAVTDFKKFK